MWVHGVVVERVDDSVCKAWSQRQIPFSIPSMFEEMRRVRVGGLAVEGRRVESHADHNGAVTNKRGVQEDLQGRGRHFR